MKNELHENIEEIFFIFDSHIFLFLFFILKIINFIYLSAIFSKEIINY